MAYYYEVKRMGKWSIRKSQFPPDIPKELKVFHTTPKLILPVHEHLPLEDLVSIYGEDHATAENVSAADGGTTPADVHEEAEERGSGDAGDPVRDV